jgi:hypothetical protein
MQTSLYFLCLGQITLKLFGQGKENIKMSAWQALKKAH